MKKNDQISFCAFVKSPKFNAVKRCKDLLFWTTEKHDNGSR
ncbi:MAG: hypothetical protein ABJQ85_09345 [Rhizobiaceae bacterium]